MSQQGRALSPETKKVIVQIKKYVGMQLTPLPTTYSV